MAKFKILFICLGNICRSPLAEGVMIDYLKKHSLVHLFEVDSAGTSAYHVGNKADPRSVEVAAKHGINLTHIARQLNQKDISYYDYFLVMDHRNYEDVATLIKNKNVLQRVFLLRSFDNLATTSYNVPDPFYGLESDFEEVFAMCQRSVSGFIKFLNDQKLLEYSPSTSVN